MAEQKVQLTNKTTNQVLVSELKVATHFWERMRGLLGTQSLSAHEGLWIHRCNSIHTFFMKYPIDVVFLNRDLQVKEVRKQIEPNRVLLPIWGASSVVELKAGVAEQLQIRKGDTLHVGA